MPTEPDFNVRYRTTLLTALLALACGAVLVLLAGCDSRAQNDSGAAPPAAPVDVAPATRVMLADTQDFTARLEAAQVVEVRPRIGGTIEQVHVKDGAEVARGALLFSIDARPYQAELARSEAALATAQAQARLADKELERARLLLPQQAISRQEVDQLAAAAETAAASARQAEAAVRTSRLNVEYTAVRSPVAGRVSRIDATLGNLVNDQRVLTTLVGSRTVHAWFDVSEQTYLRLRKAPDVQRTVRMGLSDEDGLPRRGVVDVIDNRLNAQTGTIRLRASFDNADGALTPGLFARLQVDASAPRPVVVTPDRAIATDQNRRFVWIVGADKRPEPRPVTLGALVAGMRVIDSGVKAGEQVVVGGVQRVRPGQALAPNTLAVDERGMPQPAAPPAESSASPRT